MDKNHANYRVKGRQVSLPGERSVFVGNAVDAETGDEKMCIMFKTPDLENEGKTLTTQLALSYEAASVLTGLLIRNEKLYEFTHNKIDSE